MNRDTEYGTGNIKRNVGLVRIGMKNKTPLAYLVMTSRDRPKTIFSLERQLLLY